MPRDTRQILGERIEDGVPNKELVKWLNESTVVKGILELRFGGRAITEQNLSEWKQTGHVEWRRREERRALALQLTEQRDEEALEPDESVAEKEISDRLGRELGMELARLAMALVEQEGDTETRWKRLCEVNREVSQMRRDDHRAERTRIARERWKHELEQEEAATAAQAEKEYKQQLLATCLMPVSVPTMAEAMGGGAKARTLAELIERIKAGQPLEKVSEWYAQASKKLAKESKPECVRTGGGEGRKAKGGSARSPMTKGRSEVRKTEATPQEAPSTNIQDPEKQPKPKPAESPVESNSGGLGGFEMSETEQIGPNPTKSN